MAIKLFRVSSRKRRTRRFLNIYFIRQQLYISIDIFGTLLWHAQQASMTLDFRRLLPPAFAGVSGTEMCMSFRGEASGIFCVLVKLPIHLPETSTRSHPPTSTQISRMNGAQEFLHNIFMMENTIRKLL